MRMELLQLVYVHVDEVSRPLREEVATLKLLLACVSVPLELTEECTSGDPRLVSAQALFSLDSIEQTVVEEEHLYGCFSPCGSPRPSPRPDVSVASERGH
jgi:hypothetical protein